VRYFPVLPSSFLLVCSMWQANFILNEYGFLGPEDNQRQCSSQIWGTIITLLDTRGTQSFLQHYLVLQLVGVPTHHMRFSRGRSSCPVDLLDGSI
jgi:hypothetical protein